MNTKKHIFNLIILIILVVPSFCYGVSNKNLNFKAISSTDSKTVQGLEISVYKIGTVNELNEPILDEEIANNYEEINVNSLKASDIEKIEKYVEKHYSAKNKFITDEKGELSIKNIEKGIYLFSQNNKFDTCTMQPLVTWVTGNEKNSELTVRPKIETVAEEITPIDNKNEVSENKVEQEAIVEEKEDEVLPQTGVLNLPIPILAISGIIIFAIGWYLIFVDSKKKLK